MIPIPAVLGTHETFQIFVFRALGLGAGTGIAFTFISRGADLIIALIGVFFLFRLGFKMLKDYFTKI